MKYRLRDRSALVTALSHRTWTPAPASRGDGQVHAADLQRAGVGGAQPDKIHGRVRAGAGDHAGIHVVSVTAKANAGHREFYGLGYGYCRPGGARRVDRVVTRRHAAPWPFPPSSFVGTRAEVNQARLCSRPLSPDDAGRARGQDRLVTGMATAVERSFHVGACVR
jgi:hypothetical protein